ncbi:OmpA family protein [Marinovum sp. 2_MG-2023]|uniref:OmpA family protein n=1 Tax=Roseobacteraceae TaxID=2854170 RepID=UPI001FD2EE3C|nr:MULTISPECIES: OmpA family protein [Roseobacteraceae]MCJ7872987.1 OmpA family protein [Phaeobacter sp. J2-8]MDO6731709.1 OmpA family protein [Marinovum sp. 2_MG-2023]MDO6780961.1 OmpA family protein [Marinovum sp. 1_MG-2023]
MSFFRVLLCSIPAIGFAAAVAAQSVITLDDFDLGGPTEAPQASETVGGGAMERCLRDRANCPENGGVDFTIDDVVNLGIVDREDVDVTPASVTGDDTSAAAEPLPSVDLEVLFDYNSSDIRPDQMRQLLDLANVLRSDDFSRYILIFMGHSDAKGAAEYNERLSLSRAQSVANFVAAAADVPASRIEAVGFGFQRLADPANPLSARNRRVQLVLAPAS